MPNYFDFEFPDATQTPLLQLKVEAGMPEELEAIAQLLRDSLAKRGATDKQVTQVTMTSIARRFLRMGIDNAKGEIKISEEDWRAAVRAASVARSKPGRRRKRARNE